MTASFARHTLPNGLKVVTIALPHLHSVEIGFFVKSGPRYETRETNGISHFVEHTLFRGTRSIPNTFALHAEVERLGTPISASTSRDMCQYSFQVPPEHLDRATELFAEILLEPAFQDIELERRIVLEEYLMDLNEFGEDISLENRSRALLWAEHGLGMNILGTETNIRRFSRADLEAHHRRFYTACNSVLYFAGAIDPAQALETARRYFGRVPEGVPAPEVPAPKTPRGPRYRFVENEASQIQVSLSFPGVPYTAPSYPAALLLESLLVDGMASRIPWTICERLGMSYDIDGGLESYYDTGVFDIDASIGRGKVVSLVRELLDILADMRRRPPSEEELNRARNRRLFAQRTALDNPAALASWLVGLEVHHRAPDLDEAERRYQRVSVADVQCVAEKLFRPRNLVLVVVGHLARHEKQQLLALVNGHNNGASGRPEHRAETAFKGRSGQRAPMGFDGHDVRHSAPC